MAVHVSKEVQDVSWLEADLRIYDSIALECLSHHKHFSCIMFAEQMPLWDWPCQYSGYEECTTYNNQASTSYQCSQVSATRKKC